MKVIKFNSPSHRERFNFTRGNDSVIFSNDEFVAVTTIQDAGKYDVYVSDESICIVYGDVYGRAAYSTQTAREVSRSIKKDMKSFLQQTDGRFLIIVYDVKNRQLSSFTDSTGFMHAYYCVTPQGLCLSTDIVDPLQFKGTESINRAALELYLTMQYVPHPYTMFEGIFQLPINAILQFDRWQPVTIAGNPNYPEQILKASDQDIAATIKQLLITSFRHQLPKDLKNIGGFLSGGMDTSTNNALLATEFGIHPDVFTAGFHESEYDETPFATALAEHYQLPHHKTIITAEAVNYIDGISALFDSPIADRAVLPQYILCKQASEMGLTYIVSGEGGDEILGLPRNVSEDKPFSLAKNADPFKIAYFYEGLTTLTPIEERLHLLQGTYQDKHYLAKLYEIMPLKLSSFEKIYYGQWQTWLIDNVQMKDMQVLNGLGQSYVTPYMYKPLMNYMASLPLDKKLKGLTNKAYVRQCMAPLFPDKILKKPKHKFYVPMNEWFRSEAYPLLHDTLLAKNSIVQSQMDTPTIIRLLNEHHTGITDHNRVLWALLFFELWHKNKQLQLKNVRTNTEFSSKILVR